VDSIISKQEITNNTDVNYKAGLEIVLQDNFHAKPVSNLSFSAQIEELDCNGTNISYSPPKDEDDNDMINFPVTDISNLKITNLMGILVYETKSLLLNTIELSTAPSCIYFVVVMLKDGTVLTQKMMVQ